MRRCVVVLGVSCSALFISGVVAHAAIPLLPPASTVGESESDAVDELSGSGYSPRVISRSGGGPDCVVFNQIAVSDYNRAIEDFDSPGTYDDDDEYVVFLAVECTN